MITKKPDWLKKKINIQSQKEMETMFHSLGLNTVCESAKCPNICECFDKKTATFMILGNVCTRNCRFCAIEQAKPCEINPHEPENIANVAKKLDLKHVVITSVTRDDLADGGAEHFAACVYKVKTELPKSTVELLIPDFKFNKTALDKVILSKPTIINHNLETVPSLYSEVRPMANYEQSLSVLKYIKEKNASIVTKSGIMLGIGETKDEVISLIKDLVSISCDMLTLGQYLPPSRQHLELKEYVLPEMFEELKYIATSMGIKYVASGAYVRSSYNALEGITEVKSLS